MADDVQEKVEAEVDQAPSDPWAAAFAAVDKEGEEGAAAAPGGDGPDADLPGADVPDDGEGPAQDEAGDGGVPEEVLGGPGDLGGADGLEDEDSGVFDIDVSEGQIESYRERIKEDIRQRAITDVANAYIKRGARHINGTLGANISDPDICKRDSDGVPRFYNPETGREFAGDNPRKQAQEWVDSYNRELRDAFNKMCAEYSQKLLADESGKLAVIEFAPKYKALDPVRRSMFESIIEDYEVLDKDGNVVSYSCDLDKALSAVNRQVRVIQQRFSKQRQPAQKAAPSGPALDTPSTSGGRQGGGKPQFKSIAEAMEWEQDQILARMKGSR